MLDLPKTRGKAWIWAGDRARFWPPYICWRFPPWPNHSLCHDNSGLKANVTQKKPRMESDPFTAGLRSYQRGLPFDPEFGQKCDGWGAISAQCLYERGRLKAAAAERPAKKPSK